MRFSVANGLGDSLAEPSPEERRRFLFAVDTTDEEHGAAWATLGEDGPSMEWNGDGRLVYTDQDDERTRHLSNVSRERALELWTLLIEGDFAALDREPWGPGNGYVLTPERAAELQAWQRKQDRAFYDRLGTERRDEACRHEGCRRGAIELSVFCRPHHFEQIWKRPSPFED